MSSTRVSCICNTFNRVTTNQQSLLEEAIYSFLQQQHCNKELIVINDTPGQTLEYSHADVRIFNLDTRFETLSDKIQFGIDQASGDTLCRWDDDDICLSWRLSYSLAAMESLGHGIHWKPKNYWYCPREYAHWTEVHGAANTHVQSIWTRECLEAIGGYPAKHSGDEDQAFDKALRRNKMEHQTTIPTKQLFYLYRWGVSTNHLSGAADIPANWKRLGEAPVTTGHTILDPHWARAYEGWIEAIS